MTHDVERIGAIMPKHELRREADQLLAGNSGPVERGSSGVAGHLQGHDNRAGGRYCHDGNTSAGKTHKKPLKKQRFSALAMDKLHSWREVPAGLVIYCDGACEPNPGAGGWGFAVYRDGVEIHSEFGGSIVTTNNIMEMTGALMALRWFAERGVIEPVRMLCDSQYVVRGCNEWRRGWKAKGWRRGQTAELKNAELWRELDDALALVPITLEWCKGHAGIIGNERADELSLIGREAALAAEAHDCGDLIADQLRYEVI